MVKKSEVPVARTNRTADILVGIIIGLLLATDGLLYLHNRFCHAGDPLMKVVTVVKNHTRTRFVDRRVEVPVAVDRVVDHVVTKEKLYRASQLDASGNVVQTWEVTKCKFRVIGAQLTDKDGNTFDVKGNIKIDPIK